MQLASRFPIKSNIALLSLVVISHFAVLVLAVFDLASLFPSLLVAILLSISLYYSWRQYCFITRWTDDLCWSGENWLTTHPKEQQSSVIYLELKITSWVNSHFCLLKFDALGDERAWLFTNKQLGERAYRELCFLVRSDLKRIKKQRL